ncbi:hypothetical protein CBS101457_001017 [Exobasidium rhododendri]|nr:hypothetical protein CBS101457_001017 [Exobasidium rhododendri]
MSSDLVTILGESSFPEQINEVFEYASRGKQVTDAEKKRRSVFIQRATEAEEDPSKRKIVVREVLAELTALNDGNDRELEGIFNLISSLILQNYSDEDATPLLKLVSDVVVGESSSGNTVDRSLVRYRILSNIFNSLPAASANRFTVFNSLLNLANANDELDTITDAIAAVPNWLSEWNVPATEKAALLHSIATKLQEADQGLKAYEFFLTHLRFLSSPSMSGEGSNATDTKDAAEKTIVAALDLANVFDFEELSEVEAVKKLEGEPIGKLLHIFTQGNTRDWQSWKSSNGSEIERLQLSASALERKIRLLDLAALCSRSVSSEVTYAEMAKTLEVDIEEVEVWVIDVIRVGLVSGKLSQIKQSLRVYKSVYRSFGTEQWKFLESRLSTWESSITSILDTIAESRAGISAGPRDGGIPGSDSATGKHSQIAA